MALIDLLHMVIPQRAHSALLTNHAIALLPSGQRYLAAAAAPHTNRGIRVETTLKEKEE